MDRYKRAGPALTIAFALSCCHDSGVPAPASVTVHHGHTSAGAIATNASPSSQPWDSKGRSPLAGCGAEPHKAMSSPTSATGACRAHETPWKNGPSAQSTKCWGNGPSAQSTKCWGNGPSAQSTKTWKNGPSAQSTKSAARRQPPGCLRE
jgi:hypothetical protein